MSQQHRFVLQDSTRSSSRGGGSGAAGSGWRGEWASLSQTCRVCKKPFLGGILGNAVQCKFCSFVSCQSCAANQADWDVGLYGCDSTSTTAKYGVLDDVDSPPPARRELDVTERDLVGRLAKRQEHLKECLDMMRSTTRGYRDELNRASADYTSGSARPQGDGLASVLVHRLRPVHARLREHAAAVHDLCAALDPGGAGMLAIGPAPDDQQGAATAVGVERGGYAAAAPPPAVEVSAVPVFTGQGGAVDVTKLLYKICKYRDDADIEEGMCARLGSVLEDAMPQVEFYLPALAAMAIHSPRPMPFLTKELIRLCSLSSHFALLFMWNVQASNLREPDSAAKLQIAMNSLSFDAPAQERVARIMWLVMAAVALGPASSSQGGRSAAYSVLLDLAQGNHNLLGLKEFMAGSVLGLSPSTRPSDAVHLVPFAARAGPDYQGVFFDRRAEMMQVDTPWVELIPLPPGRFTAHLYNLDDTSGESPHVLSVSFQLRTADNVQVWDCEINSREQVALQFEVTPGDGPRPTLTIQVRLKDMYQLACAVRVLIACETLDFSSSPCEACASLPQPSAPAASQPKTAAARGKRTEAQDIEDAILQSELEQAASLSREARALCAGACRAGFLGRQQKFFEGLVDISRKLVVFRQSLRRLPPAQVADKLNRQLRKQLTSLADNIPKGAYIPLFGSASRMMLILGIAAGECTVLQTPHKVHYQVYLEVLVADHGCDAMHEEAQQCCSRDAGSRRGGPFIEAEAYEKREGCVNKMNASSGRQGSSRSLPVGGAGLDESFVVVKEDMCESVMGGGAGVDGGKAGGDELMGERWSVQKQRIRSMSSLASGANTQRWDCVSLIIKSWDDLRQDHFAAQLLTEFDQILKLEGLSLPLKPYAVLATCSDGGLLETVNDARSIDSLKKRLAASMGPRGGAATLVEVFTTMFGRGSDRCRDAQRLFIRSMSAYSVFCYCFQVKDRHNGNILLCRDGSVAHVDFGILLNVRFAKDMIETRIKLSSEFVQVMGDQFGVYKQLCIEGFLAVRRHSQRLLMLLEMSKMASGAGLPCLDGDACDKLMGRLKLDATEAEAAQHMGREVDAARENVRTDILDAIHGWTHSNV